MSSSILSGGGVWFAAAGGVLDWSCFCLRQLLKAEKVLVFALGRERDESASFGNIHKGYVYLRWLMRLPEYTQRTYRVDYRMQRWGARFGQ